MQFPFPRVSCEREQRQGADDGEGNDTPVAAARVRNDARFAIR